MYVNICWAIGQLIAAGVLYALVGRPDQWAYRIPLGLQWMWPLPLIIGCFFAPESPWYLVRTDRLEEAKRSIRRLAGGKTDEQINNQLAMMVHTTKIEAELTTGTSYKECFQGVDLRRTEICCVAFAGQILSGSSFAYSPSYFFVTAGIDENKAYQLNVGGTAIAFVGTGISWVLVSYFGRRTLYVTGQAVLCCLLLMIGILNAASPTSESLWAQAAFCILWLFTYALSVGPVTYAIVSEVSSVRLRPLSVVLGRITYQLVNIVSQVLQAYFMNPTEWNASGKTGFFWAGTSFCVLIWAFFRLPEPKGRTYGELDILFARKIPARKFASTAVDAYSTGTDLSREELVQKKPTEEVKETN
jgi:SP family general alpha glucoside:H+ symporter-like MFS transporter